IPLASTRPTTRATVPGADAVSEAPPGPVAPTPASYPVMARDLPSAERLISPSDRDSPEAVSAALPSDGPVGNAIDWTGAPPACVYSSRKTGAAAVERGAPEPTR